VGERQAGDEDERSGHRNNMITRASSRAQSYARNDALPGDRHVARAACGATVISTAAVIAIDAAFHYY
jgi:hypothetical protein